MTKGPSQIRRGRRGSKNPKNVAEVISASSLGRRRRRRRPVCPVGDAAVAAGDDDGRRLRLWRLPRAADLLLFGILAVDLDLRVIGRSRCVN